MRDCRLHRSCQRNNRNYPRRSCESACSARGRRRFPGSQWDVFVAIRVGAFTVGFRFCCSCGPVRLATGNITHFLKVRLRLITTHYLIFFIAEPHRTRRTLYTWNRDSCRSARRCFCGAASSLCTALTAELQYPASRSHISVRTTASISAQFFSTRFLPLCM